MAAEFYVFVRAAIQTNTADHELVIGCTLAYIFMRRINTPHEDMQVVGHELLT